jgi:cell wall assembly regulator SMI1
MNEDNQRETVQTLWQRIESWLSRHAPHAWQMLRPGASKAEIQQAEVTLGITLPEDFKASCRIHNGGYALNLATETVMLPGGYALNLTTEMTLLPLEEVVSTWQDLKDCLEDETWANTLPEHFKEDRSRWPTVPLQLVWWHPQWIPFGSDSAGNCCCLDLAPTKGGSVGQVIDWDHEVGPTEVLASSFLEVLSAFASDLEAGAYVDTDTGLELVSEA